MSFVRDSGLLLPSNRYPYRISRKSIQLNGAMLWPLRASSPRRQQGGIIDCLMEGIFFAIKWRKIQPPNRQSIACRALGPFARAHFRPGASPQNPTTHLFAPLPCLPFGQTKGGGSPRPAGLGSKVGSRLTPTRGGGRNSPLTPFRPPRGARCARPSFWFSRRI